MRGMPLLVLIALSPLLRANPTDELLRLVPAEATVCFIAQDLRVHAARTQASPFADWVERSPWGKNFAASEDYQRLLKGQGKIAETLGVKVEALRDGIFGDAVVYAYLPGPAGKPEDDAGIFMTRAKDAELLARMVAKLNEGQKQTGEVLRVVERTHAGSTYFAREKPEARNDFYFVDGGLLFYSSRERPMLLALERKAKAAVEKEVPLFAQARKRLGFERAAFAALFAPRSIDAELKAVSGVLPNEDARAFVQQFAKFWATVEAVGLALELDAHVEISLGLVSKVPTAEPAASALWSAVPADAMLAITGKIRWNELAETARAFLGEASSAKFQQWLDQSIAPIVGREMLPKLLAGIGPDAGAWLVPPAKDSKAFLPAFALAIRIPTIESADAKLRDTLRGGFDFLVQAHRVEHNRTHADQFDTETEKFGERRLTVVSNGRALPAGVSLAYGLCEEFFVLGSNPQSVGGFPKEVKADAKHAGLLVRFSASRTVKYLREHGKALSVALAEKSGKDAAELEREFAALSNTLELFESWELRATTRGELTKYTWKIEFIKPLK